MPDYQIKNWEKHFENNRTRDLKRMDWVPIPNKMDGDGYTQLVDHPNAAAHLGAWLAIVEIASRGDREQRGTLPKSVDGIAKALARISRLPVQLFDEVIPRLIRIGWIEEVKIPQEGAGKPQEGAGKPQEGAGKPQEGAPRARAGMEGNGTEEFPHNPPEGDAAGVDDAFVTPMSRIDREFEKDWQYFWSKVGKAAARRAYRRARKNVCREKLISAVKLHGPLIIRNAMDQGITPIHPATWINAGRWDDDPAIYDRRPRMLPQRQVGQSGIRCIPAGAIE